jgi:hypothetical protein
MSKTAVIIALLVLLAIVVVVVATRKGAPVYTLVFEDGETASISCARPDVISASYGPAEASATCPTADVLAATRKILESGGSIDVSANALGVSTRCAGSVRQLSVQFRCSGAGSEQFVSRADGHASEPSDTPYLRWRPGNERPPRPTPYSKGPPLAENVWSNAAGIGAEAGIIRRRAAVRQSRGEGPASAGDSWADQLVANDAEAVGVYLPGGTRGPKREPGWAVRPGRRRTNWIR